MRADAALVAALIGQQAPQWAELAVTPLPAELEGTDHVLFRVGPDLLARMPKIDWAVEQGAQEAAWLPVLAPHVPVALGLPVFAGRPGHGYPWPWTIVRWIPGQTPPRLGLDDPGLARQVAAFARALHAVPAQGGPLCPPGSRGTAPRVQAERGRAAIDGLRGKHDGLDLDAVARAWEQVVATPDYAGEPVWLHGDLQPGNLIVADGRLSGVIDFTPRRGDPAADLAPAWWTFTGDARTLYREELADYGPEAWWRARGWALLPSLTGIDYYRNTFPRMAEHGRRTVTAVLQDIERFG